MGDSGASQSCDSGRVDDEESGGEPILADAHLHLDMSNFDSDREEVVARAGEVGVAILVQAGSDLPSSQFGVRFSAAHLNVYFTLGLHPHQADLGSDDYLQKLAGLAKEPKCVAIGEAGLDYHYDHSPRPVQRKVFARQIELAHQLNLPLVVHSREAFSDTVAVLKEVGVPAKGVLFHSFAGSGEEAVLLAEMGVYISVNGIITFPKASSHRESIAAFPTERIMLETDAPYLSPSPRRGRRNEPANLPHTLRSLAQMLARGEEELAYLTTKACRRFFNIPYETLGTIIYRVRNSLYLNITNRCNNECPFCVRQRGDGVRGYDLRLSAEPLADEVIAEIGDPKLYDEIVFCGFGEPLLRPLLVKEVAGWIKAQGGRVRINTNGTSSLYHQRDIVAELDGLVDVYSVSLNAVSEEEYQRNCKPSLVGSFKAVLSFIKRARESGAEVVATFVHLPGLDEESARRLTDELGVRLRIRAHV